ncbi:hypothetical protein [Calothrix sp. CCY 0018]
MGVKRSSTEGNRDSAATKHWLVVALQRIRLRWAEALLQTNKLIFSL